MHIHANNITKQYHPLRTTYGLYYRKGQNKRQLPTYETQTRLLARQYMRMSM